MKTAQNNTFISFDRVVEVGLELITPVEKRDDYIAARDDLYKDPTNWKNPFRFRLGIGIEF